MRVAPAGVATSIGGVDHLPETVYCAGCGTIFREGGVRVRPSQPPEEIAAAIAALPFDGLDLDLVVRIIQPPLAALSALVSSRADVLAVQVAQVAVGSLGGGAHVGEAYVTREIPANRLQLALQALLGERPEKEPLQARGIRELAGLAQRAQEILQARKTPSVRRPTSADAVAADDAARRAFGSPAGRLVWKMSRNGLAVDRLDEPWVTTVLMKYTVPRVVAEIMCRQGLLGAPRTANKATIEGQRARVKELLKRTG